MRIRGLLPSVGKIFDYWKDKHEITGFCFVDWGEPSCPGCGNQIYNIEFDKKKKDKYLRYLKEGNFIAIWNTCVGLERHHIIPFSLGGSDDVSNLFLLCHECHGEAPTTSEITAFFNWLKTPKKHNYWRKLNEKAKELSQYIDTNYDNKQQIKIRAALSNLTRKEISSYLDTKLDLITLHFNEKGGYIPESTIVHFILEGILNGELQANENTNATAF